MAEGIATRSSRGHRTIRLPIEEEDYLQIIHDPKAFRRTLDDCFRQTPELVFCPFSTVTQAAPRLKARPPGTGVRVLKRPRRTHGLQKPNSPTANALPP